MTNGDIIITHHSSGIMMICCYMSDSKRWGKLLSQRFQFTKDLGSQLMRSPFLLPIPTLDTPTTHILVQKIKCICCAGSHCGYIFSSHLLLNLLENEVPYCSTYDFRHEMRLEDYHLTPSNSLLSISHTLWPPYTTLPR